MTTAALRLTRLFTDRDRRAPRDLQTPLSSPIQIEAANVNKENLDQASILERSRIVSTKASAKPYIAVHGCYNKRWYFDVVALPNNSIRMLVSQMFDTLNSARTLSLDLSPSDVSTLSFFLKQLADYIKFVLNAEEDILFASIDVALKKINDYQSHSLHPNNRNATKTQICSLLDSLNLEKNNLTNLHYVEKLQAAVDHMWTLLNEYLAIKEQHLPRIIFDTLRSVKEKKRLERRLIEKFDKHRKRFLYTALLMTALSSDAVRLEFQHKHFNKADVAKFNHNLSNLQQSLLAVPDAFRRAADAYENQFSMQTFLKHYGQHNIVAEDGDDIVFS